MLGRTNTAQIQLRPMFQFPNGCTSSGAARLQVAKRRRVIRGKLQWPRKKGKGQLEASPESATSALAASP